MPGESRDFTSRVFAPPPLFCLGSRAGLVDHAVMSRSAQPEPARSSSGWLARALSWVVAASFGMIALFSGLIAWHFHRQTRLMRIEIDDLAAEKKSLRGDMMGEREVLVREIEEMVKTQNEVDSLISRLNGSKSPPESADELAGELARIRGLVQGKPLSEAEKKEILLTLRDLSHGVADPSQTPGASALLHALADRAMIDRAQIPAMLAVLRGEARPSGAAAAAEPPPSPPEPSPPAPPPVVVEPAVPQQTARVAVPADPLAAAVAPPPEAPPEPAPPLPPSPKPAGKTIRQEKGRFEVTFPEDWTVRDKELASGVMAMSPKFPDIPGERAYVVVNASELLNRQVLAEFTAQQSEQLARGLINARRVTEGEIRIDGRPAKFVFFSHDQTGRPFLSMYLFSTTPERGYILTFSARNDLYPRMEKAFNDIASQFKVLSDPDTGKP